MTKIYVFIICVMFVFPVLAQDTLLLENGSQLNVKVIHEDSVKVDFSMERNGKTITSWLNKSEIQSIKYGKTRKRPDSSGYPVEDLIVQTNGNVIRGAIIREDSIDVVYSVKKNGADVMSTISQSKIDHIVYGGVERHYVPEDEKGTFGIGVGRDYGGYGVNFAVYANRNAGFFAGIGYALAGMGFNGGIRIKLISARSKSRVVPVLTGMYGYNTVIIVTDAPQYDKKFNGLTFGFGIDIHTRLNNNAWSLALLLPVVDKDAENYVTMLKTSHGVQFRNEIPKVGFSIGYRIQFASR